jgi:peptidoglycan hydrolase CwlO-like protein
VSLRRRVLGVLLALAALGSVAPGAVPGAAADTKKDIQHAKDRLDVLLGKIAGERKELDAQRAQVQAAQGKLNDLALEVYVANQKFGRLETDIMGIREALRSTKDRMHHLRQRLDARARAEYENGPAGNLAFVLSATSLADLSDRVQYVSRLTQADSDLANEVQDQANALKIKERDLGFLLHRQTLLLQDLQAKQAELDKQLAAQQAIYDRQAAIVAQLQNQAGEVDSLIAKLKDKLHQEQLARARAAALAAQQGIAITGSGPFQYCPVSGPHAYGDSFGAPRYGGGYHPHAGNDIMAAPGTPVVAPFSGTVSAHPNTLGGNAIIETGPDGYIYGAHLSAYGASGSVSAGTVIGYVGNTGDAQGGPYHLHFEWHPNVIPASPYRSVYGYTTIGDAVDPFPYLNLVC